MILKVFDVDQGSCNFIKTTTGKTELVDFGGKLNWSPVKHIFDNYIVRNGRLDRLVLTHHHGDHLQDWGSFMGRRPDMLLRRSLSGDYLYACRRSNSSGKQKLAEDFDAAFSSWTHSVDPNKLSEEYWGFKLIWRSLTVEEAQEVSSTDNSLVNNCSYVRLYNHNGTKILLAGDMEKEGMVLLLKENPTFRSQLKGVNILVAPHHGHKTSFCTELFDATGQVDIVLASMMSGDTFVDTRYSDANYVRGIRDQDGSVKRMLTTRTYGAMTVESRGSGRFHISINQR